MAKLSQEQQDALAELERLRDAPEETSSGPSVNQNVNVTIDLDNEVQVRRAVKSGLLPASYLDDDEAEDDTADDDADDEDRDVKKEPGPRRRLDKRYA